MSSFMDTAKENFKKLPKWAWFASIGGFVLVAWYSSKNKVTYQRTPTYGEDFGGGNQNVGNINDSGKISEEEMAKQIGQVINDLTGKFTDQMNDLKEGYEGQLGNLQTSYEQQLIGMESQWAQQFGGLDSMWNEKVNALTSSYNEQLFSTQSQLDNMTSLWEDESSKKQTQNVFFNNVQKPNASIYQKELSSKVINEIARKASTGEKLANPTATSQKLYDEYQAYYKAETQLKALQGQQLSKPTEWKNQIYGETVSIMGGNTNNNVYTGQSSISNTVTVPSARPSAPSSTTSSTSSSSSSSSSSSIKDKLAQASANLKAKKAS